MSQLIELILELSVVNMALSFLLISRTIEAERKEPGLVKHLRKYALAYFVLLFISFAISLSVLFYNNYSNYLEDKMLNYISTLAVLIPFVSAIIILYWLVAKIYDVTEYIQDSDEQNGKATKKKKSEEVT